MAFFDGGVAGNALVGGGPGAGGGVDNAWDDIAEPNRGDVRAEMAKTLLCCCGDGIRLAGDGDTGAGAGTIATSRMEVVGDGDKKPSPGPLAGGDAGAIQATRLDSAVVSIAPVLSSA